LESKILIKYRG